MYDKEIKMKESEKIQQEYYQRTAKIYDQLHIHDGHDGEHETALKYAQAFMNVNRVKSVLDIGCGTGRALKILLESGFDAKGVEPVQELINIAVSKGIDSRTILKGSGYKLDFPDRSFDAVCSFGILHHVEYPERVVREMMRVSRKMIFISDANRFGQGAYVARLLKFLVFKIGCWKLFDIIRTKGKRYMLSEGDGLYYSFSIYDILPVLNSWTN